MVSASFTSLRTPLESPPLSINVTEAGLNPSSSLIKHSHPGLKLPAKSVTIQLAVIYSSINGSESVEMNLG